MWDEEETHSPEMMSHVSSQVFSGFEETHCNSMSPPPALELPTCETALHIAAQSIDVLQC